MTSYSYSYRTSEGERRIGDIDASTRDEAFALLRKQGIRPIKVIAKDGSKENGAPRRARRGLIAVVGVVLVVMVGAVAFLTGRRTTAPVLMTPQGPVTFSFAQPLTRQQIGGNRQRLENLPTNFFNSAAEAFLAQFAEPGRAWRVAAEQRPTEEAFRACLRAPIRIASNELTEYTDLKRILAGLKVELRGYLAGGGTSDGYVNELVKRQRMEIAYREGAEKRLAGLLPDVKAAYAYWLKANAQLEAMGIAPLALPEALREYQMSVGLEE